MGRGKDIVSQNMASPLSLDLHVFLSRYNTYRSPERTSCLSREDFDKLRSGEEEESLEVGLKSWCIVKLDGVRPAGTCSLES